jgi:mannose-6-phosphate isomerase-like protein (cupin superfamily)
MQSTLLRLGGSLLVSWTVGLSSPVQAHTFHDLPPVPDDLMKYIHMADEGTLPDPLDPNLTKFWVAGGRNTYLKTGADTNGQYSLFDLFVPPNVGPPLHIHQKEAEWFYVYEGNASFQMEDEVIQGSPGTLIYGPKGHLHTFKNLTDTPVKMLLFYEPSGIEDFFTEVGQPVIDPINPPGFEPETLLTSGAKHGLIFPSTFIFATPEFTTDTGVTVIRTGAPNEAVGVTLELSDGTEIILDFGIGESVKTIDLSLPDDYTSLDLLLKSPTPGAQIGLLENKAVLNQANSSSVPETSSPFGLLALGGLWLALRLSHSKTTISTSAQNN